MMLLRLLIADDEPLARERMRHLLSDDPGLEIVGECKNGREVLAALQRSPVDILFLDIQMPGRSGFEVLEQAVGRPLPAIVFVTAHSHYAVQAFEVNALDYLTKPVEKDRLKAAVSRARERLAAHRALATQEQLRAVLSLEPLEQVRTEYPARILISDGAKDCFVALQDVDWIEAADYYSCLHVEGRTFMLREPIKQLAERLNPKEFVRIHRSVIVNLSRVEHVIREGRGEGVVVLRGGRRLRMSSTGWKALVMSQRAANHS